MTQEEEFAATHILLETFEVDLVLSVHEVKPVSPQRAPKVLRHMDIGVIHRRLYQYSIAWLSEAADDECYARNDARNEVEPLRLNGPTIAALLPSYDGGVPARSAHGISQNFVVETATQLVDDEGRRSKVHISYPEREQVIASPDIVHSINLQGISTAAIIILAVAPTEAISRQMR